MNSIKNLTMAMMWHTYLYIRLFWKVIVFLLMYYVLRGSIQFEAIKISNQLPSILCTFICKKIDQSWSAYKNLNEIFIGESLSECLCCLWLKSWLSESWEGHSPSLIRTFNTRLIYQPIHQQIFSPLINGANDCMLCYSH